MALETVRQMWDRFAAAVLPPDVSPADEVKARLTFYAGASYMLDTVMAIGDPGVSEAAGADHMEAMHQELVDFTIDAGLAFKGAKGGT